MNWESPGTLTLFFCVVVLVISVLPVFSVISNLRKVSEHTKRISQAPMFLQVSTATTDMQRLARTVAVLPSYVQRIKTAFAAARVAVGETNLGTAVQSMRVAMTAIRLLIADMR